MLILFPFLLLSQLLPLALLFMASPRLRGHALALFPLGVAFEFFYVGVFAALTSRVLPFGLLLYIIAHAAATGATYASLLPFHPKAPIFCAKRQGRILLAIGLLALLSIADVYGVLSAQGWSFQPWSWPAHGPSYFQGPFFNDLERDVLLVNALLRRGGSPFLPHHAINYQLFWYELCATYVSFFHGITNYPLVLGASLATAFLLYFVLYGSAIRICPSLMKRPAAAALLLAAAALHGNAILLLARLLHTPAAKLPTHYYVPFSLKLTAMTAPQHAAFLILLIPFVALALAPMGASRAKPLLSVMGFVASPILALFFFPLFAVFDCFRAKRVQCLWAWGSALGVAIASYVLIYGSSPLALFQRPVARLRFPLLDPWLLHKAGWLLSPLSLFAAGAGAAILPLFLLWRRGSLLTSRLRPILFSTMAAFAILNFGVTDWEIRRHASLLVAGIAPLLLLPLLRTRRWRRYEALFAILIVSLSLASEGIYVRAKTKSPSFLESAIPWEDYFKMNQVIRARFPRWNVLAATGGGRGMVFPVVMEATTSFSSVQDLVVHTRLPRSVWPQVEGWKKTDEVLSRARALGYQAIEWGPLEERRWGERWRQRLAIGSRRVTRVGAVGLYTLP